MPIKIIIKREINIHKLIGEFAKAGFLQTSSRPNEFITVEDSDDEKAVMAIYDAHDPTPLPLPPTADEKIAELQAKIEILTKTANKAGLTSEELATLGVLEEKLWQE